jgi:hypothetical protein
MGNNCCKPRNDCCHKKKKKKKKGGKGKKDECADCRDACGCCDCGGCCGTSGMSTNDPTMAINTGRILTLESMGFDEDGNVRHGMVLRDKMGEMQKVIWAESQAKKKKVTNETVWAIVDATWLCQWLMFVHSDELIPAPGPVHNYRLVYQNEKGVWKPRVGLVMEKSGHIGDYRKISMETWRVFQELYPGSAPTITATFQETYDKSKGEVDTHAEDGHYRTNHWVIAEAKKYRKSSLNIFEKFGIGRSMNDVRARAQDEEEEEEEEEREEEEADDSAEGRSNMKKRRSVEVARKRRDSLRSIQESAAKEELESSVKEELQSTAKEELESTAKEGAGKSLTSGAERTTPYKAPDRAKPARRADEFYDDIFNRTSEEDDTL